LPDAFRTRATRSDGFTGELVGPLVQLDARVPAHVYEARGGTLGEPIAHALDERKVRLRLPPLREHADGVRAVGVDHERAARFGHDVEHALDGGELGDVVR